MSTTSSPTAVVRVRNGAYYLCAFDKLMAPIVAGWPRDDRELFWLAPKTPPPLTPAKVTAWPGPDGCPLLFRRDGVDEPLGYIELNPMPAQKRHLWMGHCVVPHERRGCGLGRAMVELMLDEAFLRRRADRVSLIVFPDNVRAIRCYRRVGFVDASEQLKHFPTTGRQHRMLRMSIDREQYELARRESAPR